MFYTLKTHQRVSDKKNKIEMKEVVFIHIKDVPESDEYREEMVSNLRIKFSDTNLEPVIIFGDGIDVYVPNDYKNLIKKEDECIKFAEWLSNNYKLRGVRDDGSVMWEASSKCDDVYHTNELYKKFISE